VLLELSVTVVAGSLTVAVLFTVVVTVIAAPFNPGVKFETTPGVLVRLGGDAGLAGAVLLELRPSDIGDSGATTVELLAAEDGAARLDEEGGDCEPPFAFGAAVTVTVDGELPPGAGYGPEAAPLSFGEADVVEVEGRLPPGAGYGWEFEPLSLGA
jgi:hypothetical protein